MLPTNSLYTRKRESAAGRRQRSAIQPQQGGGPYTGGQVININIPTAANQLLIPSESTLNFTINVTNASGNTMSYLRWDSCGAHGLIQRLRIYHGSALLEDLDVYNQAAKTLFDMSVPYDAAAGRHTVAGGTRSDAYALPATTTSEWGATYSQANAVSSTNRLAPVRYSNSGDLIASALPSTAQGVIGASRNYSINLISLLGSLSSKYLPLFAMSAAPLRLEVQLVNTLAGACLCDQICSSTAVSFTLSNVEYVGEFLTLSDSAISTILQQSDSPLQWTCPAISNYAYSVPISAGVQISVPIAAKYSSLKGLFSTIRNTAAGVAAQNFYPFTSHSFGLSQAFWRIGSDVLPNKPLVSTEEFFTEALKVFGSLADQTFQPAIDRETYTMTVPVVGTEGEPNKTGASQANLGSGAFVAGLDLEVFAGTDRDAMFQGLNTNTSDVFAVFTFGASTPSISARIDSFSLYDRLIICENGAAYTRF